MKQAMSVEIKGIKCDGCDYKDESVKVKEYEAWLNRPCPQCGANLLTEADYHNVKVMMEFVKLANKITPPQASSAEPIRISAEMNGTGKVDYKIKS